MSAPITHGSVRKIISSISSKPFAILIIFFLYSFWALGSATESEPWEYRVALNNDLLGNNTVKDDFYTFGIRLEAAHENISFRLEENAFTDRLDGYRFDETYLTAGRLLPIGSVGNWCVWIEGGVAHIGEGLLGQSAQNSVHDILGDEPVFLDYIDADEYRFHFRGEIGQQWHLSKDWTWGPQVGVSFSSNLRWNSLVGFRTIWRPTKNFGVDVILGGRFSGTDIALLEPHLKDKSIAAQVNLELPYGFILEWSRNRYGTEREHVSLGYHLGTGQSPSRHGAWNQAHSTP